MMYSRSHGAVVLSLSLLLLSACATEETMTSSGSGSTSAASASGSMKAAAQAYDSLQACLDRIPSGGTAGNRLVAEESCRRDESLRQSIAGNATAGNASAAANGGPARIGVQSQANAGGNAASGAVTAVLLSGAAISGAAANGDSTTGTSTGGSSTMDGNALIAGDSKTGSGGDAGAAITGNSIGGDGGNAGTLPGVGHDLDAGSGAHTSANGANAGPTGIALSFGGPSGSAPGGDVHTSLESTAGAGAGTADINLDPVSGVAHSGDAQTNVPVNSGIATGADAVDNHLAATSLSLGGYGDGGVASALSEGGLSSALNDADGSSHALVLGYADGGDGALGGMASIDIGQGVDPIVIAPCIELPYTQTNTSHIFDGNEFQGDHLHLT